MEIIRHKAKRADFDNRMLRGGVLNKKEKEIFTKESEIKRKFSELKDVEETMGRIPSEIESKTKSIFQKESVLIEKEK